MKLIPTITCGTIAALLLLTAGLAACTDSNDLPTDGSLAPTGVTSILAAKPGYTALPATRTSTAKDGSWQTGDQVTDTIRFYSDAEGKTPLKTETPLTQTLTYTAPSPPPTGSTDPDAKGSWKANATVSIPLAAKSMRVTYSSTGTKDALSNTSEGLTGHVAQATGTVVKNGSFRATQANDYLIPITNVIGTLKLDVVFERTTGLVSVLLQPGQEVTLSIGSGSDVKFHTATTAATAATAHFHLPAPKSGVDASTVPFTLRLKDVTETAYKDLSLCAGWKYTLDARYITGGEGEGGSDHQFVTADGMTALDAKIFNAQNPVWLITGGGNDANTVLTYVKAALKDLSAGSISLTLTGVTGLPDDAFNGCATLAAIALPLVTDIGIDTFNGCTALAAIDLPKATGIGDGAFKGCTALTAIDLPLATGIGDGAFNGCTALATASLPLATHIGAINKSRAIIEDGAFQSCTALAAIDLSLAETIGNNAFNGCKALTAIDLPKATTIGASAFNGCNALTAIDLPLATTIGASAFASCKALNPLSLPLAKKIGASAFNDCTTLNLLSLPTATDIGASAFNDCTTLARLELTVAGEIRLADDTFAGCPTTTLILDSDKQYGGTGKPTVTAADGKDWGTKATGTPATWLKIGYTGTSLPGLDNGGKPY